MSNLNNYIQLIRPLNVLIAGISIFIGGAVTGTISPLLNLILASVSGMLITGGANSINDYFDVDIDRINKPQRPLPRNAVSLENAFIFSIVLFVAGIIPAFFINFPSIVIASLSAILLFFYSRNLKRTVLAGNITVAFMTGLAFIYGGMALGHPQNAFIVGIFAFFYHLGREIIKDIEDIEGDSKDGVITFPIYYGVKPALVCATSVLSFLIILTLIPYFLGWFNQLYLWIVLVGVDFFLLILLISLWRNPEKSNLGKWAFYMKLNMFIGLLAVYLGS